MKDYNYLLNKTMEFDGQSRNVSAILWDNAERKCRLQVTFDNFNTENFDFSFTNGDVTLQKCQNGGVLLFLSQEVFDTNGKRLGNLQNVIFTKSGAVKSLIVNDKTYAKSKIRCIGDVILLKETPLHTTRSKRNKFANTATVNNSSDVSKSCNTCCTPNRIRRKYGDFGFLTGRRVDKTIVNFQGEVMIKCNEIVTEETLRQAKISGKLIEIFLHSE